MDTDPQHWFRHLIKCSPTLPTFACHFGPKISQFQGKNSGAVIFQQISFKEASFERGGPLGYFFKTSKVSDLT